MIAVNPVVSFLSASDSQKSPCDYESRKQIKKDEENFWECLEPMLDRETINRIMQQR